MRNKRQRYDVVVIGSGLAGMMAAATARLSGASVALLSEGNGVLELSSGSIDLLAGEDPWAGVAALSPTHPYSLVGTETVAEAFRAFRSMTADMGLRYAERPDRKNHWLPTAVGELRPTYLAAPGATAPVPGQPVRVVGFQGLKEFHPGVVAEGLRRRLPDTEVQWCWVPSPVLHPVQLARLLETEGMPALPHFDGLTLLPAVLGLEHAAEVRARLDGPVGEVPLLSPSVPGLRLAMAWSRYLHRIGVELCQSVNVTAALVEGESVQSVTGHSASGAIEYVAGSFILATGGLLGGGLHVRDRAVVEPVFGLPVAAADSLRAGVVADASLRPAGFANLYICGRMLAGYDPYGEGSGGGVAIATGWRAGTLAGGGAR
ncbi:MAG TPA: anaerobic glycerol-3-phosphate dehydrogenase subunit B [Symbiobacteriaceae bacterium]|nr:anaerobic glycerol-3-phosphate dehydrogenase subunit B [Symbiobacteriaceae bacterium]